MATVNVALLNKLIEKKLDEVALPRIKGQMKRKFTNAKKEMLQEFDNSAVTQEIEAGPDSSSSQFLPKGNLFSFLGFERGTKPTEKVREMLDKETKLVSVDKVISHKDGTYSVVGRVEVPTLAEVNARNELSWINRGWVDAVENGLMGLPAFIVGIFNGGNSRSGTGLEARNAVRTGSFTGIGRNYVSKFLRDFKNTIRGK